MTCFSLVSAMTCFSSALRPHSPLRPADRGRGWEFRIRLAVIEYARTHHANGSAIGDHTAHELGVYQARHYEFADPSPLETAGPLSDGELADSLSRLLPLPLPPHATSVFYWQPGTHILIHTHTHTHASTHTHSLTHTHTEHRCCCCCYWRNKKKKLNGQKWLKHHSTTQAPRHTGQTVYTPSVKVSKVWGRKTEYY